MHRPARQRVEVDATVPTVVTQDLASPAERPSPPSASVKDTTTVERPSLPSASGVETTTATPPNAAAAQDEIGLVVHPDHGDVLLAPQQAPASGETTEPGQYEETSDNEAFFDYPSGSAGSAAQITRGDTERIRFYVYVQCEADGVGCNISVSIDNTSGRTIFFPGGLQITITTSQDGTTTQIVTLDDPAVTQLEHGAIYSGSTPFTLEGPGTYSGTGHVTIELGA